MLLDHTKPSTHHNPKKEIVGNRVVVKTANLQCVSVGTVAGNMHKRELCPAFGKTCSKCHKLNHFAKKCRSGKEVKAVEENDEVDTIDMLMDPMKCKIL